MHEPNGYTLLPVPFLESQLLPCAPEQAGSKEAGNEEEGESQEAFDTRAKLLTLLVTSITNNYTGVDHPLHSNMTQACMQS